MDFKTEKQVYAGAEVKQSDYNDQLQPTNVPLTFGRFEFKYILNQRLRELIEAGVLNFMRLDPLSVGLPDSVYMVNSLYFDDPFFNDYYQKTDGLLNRKKFRFRSYGIPGTVFFLEEKGRRNNFSYKHRCQVEEDFYSWAQTGQWSELLEKLGPSPNRPCADFVIAGLKRNLAPKVRVIYRRRPYISRHGSRFRVTFDDLLTAQLPESNAVGSVASVSVMPSMTIMEIKFEHSIPRWFLRLITTYQLHRISISKYCKAAEALAVVQNLE